MTAVANDDDVQVTFEDQKKINLFARKNLRVTELVGEIEDLKKQLQNIEDASDDLLMLDDEDTETIPFKIGEVFVNQSMERTEEMLQSTKDYLQKSIKNYEKDISDMKQVMNDLKVQLYAKFGDSINLEA